MRAAEATTLDEIRNYWRGEQSVPAMPENVPTEVGHMAKMSRVNVCSLVVNVPAQSMFAVGFRDEDARENDPVWDTWQANRMDKHQSAVHRAAFAYGTSYASVLPGDPQPLIRGASPRQMIAAYADDLDWPKYALEVHRAMGDTLYRLYDETHVYDLIEDPKAAEATTTRWAPQLIDSMEHNAGVCPVVRFQNTEDLEGSPCSEITPIMPLQDQLDFTTFDLLVAQHYGAFRQRYVLGWTSTSETEKAKAAASRLWTFDDDSKDIRVGEFAQTDLKGYLDSRQATLEQFGIVSQVPPHNLLGQMVNLSAEALVAAEVGHTRKMAERETSFGESWEQVLWLAGKYTSQSVGHGAQIRWRDTEARSLAQTVDALGKMVTMLGVPAEATWERIPGVTQQDIDAWKLLIRSGDALGLLRETLDRQTQPA
jgi:hypothetical protein